MSTHVASRYPPGRTSCARYRSLLAPRPSPPANRAAPSSAVPWRPRPSWASSARPWTSGSPAPSSTARRSESIVSCGNAAIASAIASARSRCPPAATISVTSPNRSASSTSITRPEITRSSARPLPTIRGSRCVPPSISGTPKRRSVKPKRALGVATRRSHHSASSKPPARHQPDTAAIVGFGEARRVKPSGPSGRSSRGPMRVERLQVGAGAERLLARARDDEHARAVVGDERAEGLVQRLGGRAVDRVAALRAVDGDDRGGAGALVVDQRGGGATSRRACRRGRGAPSRPSCAGPCACPGAT